MNIDDYNVGDPVIIPFNTNSQQGGAIAPSGPFNASDVVIYKWLDTSEKATTNGVIMFSPFNGVDGSHLLILDTSNSTGDVGFWESGKTYTVSLEPDETVDGQTVVKWIGEFRLGFVPDGVSAQVASDVAAALAASGSVAINRAVVGGTITLWVNADYTIAQDRSVDVTVPAGAFQNLDGYDAVYLGVTKTNDNTGGFTLEASDVQGSDTEAQIVKFEPSKETETSLLDATFNYTGEVLAVKNGDYFPVMKLKVIVEANRVTVPSP